MTLDMFSTRCYFHFICSYLVLNVLPIRTETQNSSSTKYHLCQLWNLWPKTVCTMKSEITRNKNSPLSKIQEGAWFGQLSL